MWYDVVSVHSFMLGGHISLYRKLEVIIYSCLTPAYFWRPLYTYKITWDIFFFFCFEAIHQNEDVRKVRSGLPVAGCRFSCRLPIQLPVADSDADSAAGCRFRCRFSCRLPIQMPIQMPIQLPVADSVADSDWDIEHWSERKKLQRKYKWRLWT